MDAAGGGADNAPMSRTFPRCALLLATFAGLLGPGLANAEVVRLEIARREVVLNGKAFGAAGPYEKIVGTVDFALGSQGARTTAASSISSWRRATRAAWSSSRRLLSAEAGRSRARQRPAVLRSRQPRHQADPVDVSRRRPARADPATDAEFGNGALMRQGFTLLWMGWQWDVPGRPHADGDADRDRHGQPITGLVRGNFIPERSARRPRSVADRGHQPIRSSIPRSAEHVMTVRDAAASIRRR